LFTPGRTKRDNIWLLVDEKLGRTKKDNIWLLVDEIPIN